MTANQLSQLPSVLPEGSQGVDQIRDGRRERSGTTRQQVVMVPDGYGGNDCYIVCACGWCSLPLVERPREVVCEACEVLAEGREHFARWFAPNAARFGQTVLETREQWLREAVTSHR